ncbi:class A beta-lactamase-related serine hydrolase [Desertihabitans brevis]|uniref:Class A beta-lactamase-related serine hydrolase n=1 Tax=Desertihabitans brevis TaxID=2268447 RepID=A0A367YXE2_9ACTN|nr:serine hydrolase domain-containing protein [Desertihabitans brevis]RCK69611.1 class A beta-lactamase-related serine hydrolase [Desertihabitans brevis]
MDGLQELVEEPTRTGSVPGVVALVATGGRREVAVAGVRSLGGAAMSRDTVFRIASMTKPLVAAAAMVLVDRGRLGLDDEVRRWLPELAAPSVLRTPTSELDDVVPAERPITVRHLLEFSAGHGLVPQFDAPVVVALQERLHQGPPEPQRIPAPQEWVARLAEIPLVHQPGRGWTYNTGADVLGVLLARVAGTSLSQVLADTVLDPLGLHDTGFSVPAGSRDRFATSYRADDSGDLVQVDGPDGQWSEEPAFASGAGGTVSTVDDWCTFAQMLLAGGQHAGRTVLSTEAVRQMISPQNRAEPGNLFLQDQAWGFGGSVDVSAGQLWEVPGRYGWMGGTGTAGYLYPATGTVAVWLSQREMAGPADLATVGRFLTAVARPGR